MRLHECQTLQWAVTCMCVGVLHAPARETSLSTHTGSVYRNERRLGQSVLFAEITHICTASSMRYYISSQKWQPRYQHRLQPIICISGLDDKQSLRLWFVFRVSVYQSMRWLTTQNKQCYLYANSQWNRSLLKNRTLLLEKGFLKWINCSFRLNQTLITLGLLAVTDNNIPNAVVVLKSKPWSHRITCVVFRGFQMLFDARFCQRWEKWKCWLTGTDMGGGVSLLPLLPDCSTNCTRHCPLVAVHLTKGL